MQVAADSEFIRALAGSYKPLVQVDAWRDGRQVAAKLPVAGGQVKITAGQAIRSTVSISFKDGESSEYKAGSLVPRSGEDILHPLSGTVLQVSAGLELADGPKMMTLGTFVPTDADPGAESYRLYQRASSTVAVAEPTVTTVDCADMAHRVRNDRFMAVEQPKVATPVTDEMARLLRDCGIGFIVPAGTPSWTVPSDITYDGDRLDTLVKLAAVLDRELIFRSNGVATLQVPSVGTSVWRVEGGDEGGLITFGRKATDEGWYNAVVVTGAELADGTAIRAVATLNDGPGRFGGPYGRKPYFFSSPLITSQSSAQAAANTRLANLVAGQTMKIPVNCAWNPALECGDTVTVVAPSGKDLPGRVVEITWPLLRPTSMSLLVAVSPGALEAA